MEKRRMCPNCRAFVTTDDRVCPYCDVPLGARVIDQRSPDDLLGGLIPHARFLTVLLLVVNSGLYAAMMLMSFQRGNTEALMSIDNTTLYLFGGKFWRAVWQGHEYWRLVTAGFLHGSLIHIAMNAWVLFDLGANVEEAFGAARMAVIWFVATVAGFFLSAWWTFNPSVGASAGIYGLIGAMIAFGMGHRTLMGQMIKTHYSRWAIYGLLMGILGIFPIDNAAHLGGLGGGFVVAWIAGEPSIHPWRERIWNWLCAICVAITVICFAEMFLRLAPALGQ